MISSSSPFAVVMKKPCWVFFNDVERNSREIPLKKFTVEGYFGFLVAVLFGKMVNQINSEFCWDIGTLGTIQNPSTTNLTETSKIRFFRLLTTVFRRKFLVSVEGRHLSDGSRSEQSEMNKRFVAVLVYQCIKKYWRKCVASMTCHFFSTFGTIKKNISTTKGETKPKKDL